MNCDKTIGQPCDLLEKPPHWGRDEMIVILQIQINFQLMVCAYQATSQYLNRIYASPGLFPLRKYGCESCKCIYIYNKSVCLFAHTCSCFCSQSINEAKYVVFLISNAKIETQLSFQLENNQIPGIRITNIFL